MIETNLVDFSNLELDPSSPRRNELMKSVASLFAFASERCTLEQIEIYDEVLTRLADMVETEARSFAAEKIAPLRRAPEGVVRRFAHDEAISVAGPILEASPVLNERDLLAVAESKGNSHLVAIAQRSVLSEQVTDVVVRRGDREVKLAVAGNHGAKLGDAALFLLVQQAMSDVPTAEALGQHPDTPDSVIAQMVAGAAEAVRKAISGRGMKTAEKGLTEASRRAAERMSNAYWLGLYDFETAWEKIAHQGGRRIVSESLLCQYAMDDRFADVVAVFALLADLDLEETKYWLVRTDTEPFSVITKSLGLRFSTVQMLLKTGPWKHRLTNDQRRDALNQFQTIDQRAARSRIAAWRQTRLTG
jgi:uncharacterized protein (DUF2336 family)